MKTSNIQKVSKLLLKVIAIADKEDVLIHGFGGYDSKDCNRKTLCTFDRATNTLKIL